MRFIRDLKVEDAKLAEAYERVLTLLNQLPRSREQALALTNLENSALWAGVAVRVSEQDEE